MMLTLAQAAEEAHVDRSTVFRWIRKGAVSGAKAPDGFWRVDAADLHRYLSACARPVPGGLAHEVADAAAQGEAAPLPHADAEARLEQQRAAHEAALLRVQLDALHNLLEAAKRREADLMAERDRWAAQAERLALPAPVPAIPPARSRWWWRRAG